MRNKFSILLRGVITSGLVVGVVLSSTVPVNAATEVPNQQQNAINPTLILDFDEKFTLADLQSKVEGTPIDTVEGTYLLNGETISFGFNNINELSTMEVIERVRTATLRNVRAMKSGKDAMFQSYGKNQEEDSVSVDSLQVGTVKLSKNVELIRKKYLSNPKVKIRTHGSKAASDDSKQAAASVGYIDRFTSWLKPDAAHAAMTRLGGDPVAPLGDSNAKMTGHPKQGDRQDRLGLVKRTTGYQYNWLPSNYVVDVHEINSTSRLRQVNVGLKFNSLRMGNLKLDNNEALEAEVLFYNYGPSSSKSLAGNGYAYMYSQEYWNHNIPAEAYPYLDTRYSDNKLNGQIDEVSFCIGIANVNALKTDVMYWYIIQGYPLKKFIGNQKLGYYTTISPQSTGLAKFQIQRSYNYVSDLLTKLGHPSNGHDAWSVFNEEYEKIISPLEFSSYKVPQRVEGQILGNEVYLKRSK